MNQNHAGWDGDRGFGSGSDEAEPSLGWPAGRGHPQTVMPGYDEIVERVRLVDGKMTAGEEQAPGEETEGRD
jgi:hypothetical protein